MRTLYMTVGAPGSGKTTWAADMVDRNPNMIRVERDDIRNIIAGKEGITPHGDGWKDKHEKEVSKRQKDAVHEALTKSGFDVIVSDTNLSSKATDSFEHLAENAGAKIQYVHFFASRETLHQNNKKRDGWKRVPDHIVDDMYRRHVELAPFNHSNEYMIGDWDDFGDPFFAFVNRENVQAPNKIDNAPAVIFDIDGTLAHRRDRSPFDDFRVDEDDVDEIVKESLLMYFHKGYSILLVSGRGENAREKTTNWMVQNRIPFNELHMRAKGDTIKDSIVKHDIYLHEIWPYYDVRAVFDDRNQTVRMWRDMGCKTFQVEDGDF